MPGGRRWEHGLGLLVTHKASKDGCHGDKTFMVEVMAVCSDGGSIFCKEFFVVIVASEGWLTNGR